MREKIEKQIRIYIYQILDAIEKGKKADNENPKLDFKRIWYDLKSKVGINEFLKDTTAIANTVGLDGFIVFGFDDKTGEFFDSYFEDSMLSDTSELNGIIIKRCSNLFDVIFYPIEIEGKRLSVLHIPPTLEKPIVITNYQKFNKDETIKGEEAQRIFIRKGTAIHPASKYDLEMMFYDRKNIKPDYELELEIVAISFLNGAHRRGEYINNAFQFYITFNYENLGRKSISIHKLALIIKTTSFSSEALLSLGGETWAKGEVKKTKNYQFIVDYNDTKCFLEADNREELELFIRIEMNNGKQLFKTFDFIPEYSR